MGVEDDDGHLVGAPRGEDAVCLGDRTVAESLDGGAGLDSASNNDEERIFVRVVRGGEDSAEARDGGGGSAADAAEGSGGGGVLDPGGC